MSEKVLYHCLCVCIIPSMGSLFNNNGTKRHNNKVICTSLHNMLTYCKVGQNILYAYFYCYLLIICNIPVSKMARFDKAYFYLYCVLLL